MKPTLRLLLTGRRRGVALIVVLAMATLLTAVAVSLVSATRVDRLAGANYLDSVVARRLVPAAVHEALDRSLSQFAEIPGVSPKVRMIPMNQVFSPSGTGPALSPADIASLKDSVTLAYFHTNNVTSVQNAINGLAWTPLTDAAGKVVGRFAAVIEDQSGLLDINAITGMNFPYTDALQVTNVTPRTYIVSGGTQPSEFRVIPYQLSATEILATETAPALSEQTVVQRMRPNPAGALIRFESMPDIRTYAGAGSPGGEVERFTYFSRGPLIPNGYRDNTFNAIKMVDLSKINSGDPVVSKPTATDVEVLGVFNNLLPGAGHSFGGSPVRPADIAFDAINDYIDTNHVPRNKFFSSERAFMWNEIGIGVTVSQGPVGPGGIYPYSFSVYLSSELFYPYTTSNSAAVVRNDAVLQIEYTLEVTDKNNQKYVLTSAGPDTLKNEYTGESATPSTAGATRFRSIPAGNQKKDYTLGIPSDSLKSLVLKPKLIVAEVTTSGVTPPQVVDEISVSASMPEIKVSDWSKIANGEYLRFECLDPRANYTFDGFFSDIGPASSPWKVEQMDIPGSGSLGQINFYTSATINSKPPGFFDVIPAQMNSVDAYEQFVRNGNLDVVGELGFLPYSAWRTLKLFGATPQEAHPVTDFCMVTNCFSRISTNYFGAGHINPNTHDARVLAVAFEGLRLERFPRDNSFVVMDFNSALNDVASKIVRNVASTAANRKFPFLNASDCYNVPALGDSLYAGPYGALSELRREAIVRNSQYMLSTENNFMQILILVQAVKLDGNVQVPVATEKVIATVWRRPVSRIPSPTLSGERVNRYFIRSITALND